MNKFLKFCMYICIALAVIYVFVTLETGESVFMNQIANGTGDRFYIENPLPIIYAWLLPVTLLFGVMPLIVTTIEWLKRER